MTLSGTPIRPFLEIISACLSRSWVLTVYLTLGDVLGCVSACFLSFFLAAFFAAFSRSFSARDCTTSVFDALDEGFEDAGDAGFEAV